MQRISPFLWFNNNAEEAANFYTSIFKNSSIGHVSRYGKDGPGPEGTVMVISFTIDGQTFTALNGGPMYKFTEAVSFVISCKDQAEIDYYWERLGEGSGDEGQCGWLKDKFGLSWQIVPEKMGQLMGGTDAAGSARAMRAMMSMKKIDLPTLERAYAGG